MLDNKIPPPVVGALVALAMWLSAPLGPRFGLPDPAGPVLTGLLLVAGITFDLSGLLVFRAARTTINPLRPQRAAALVTTGVYRLTRNPMYVGMACLLGAWAVHLSSWPPLAGIVLFVAYITRFQIQPEERALAALFGAQYADYAARVRRWL